MRKTLLIPRYAVIQLVAYSAVVGMTFIMASIVPIAGAWKTMAPGSDFSGESNKWMALWQVGRIHCVGVRPDRFVRDDRLFAILVGRYRRGPFPRGKLWSDLVFMG